MSYEYLGSTNIPTQSIDWLTITSPGSADMREEMFVLREALDPNYELEGKEWSFFGYKGMTYGKFSIGTRRDEGLMQFRGYTAHEAVSLIPHGWKATRLDLQASILLEEATPMAKRYFQSLGGSDRVIRPMLRFMSSSNGGGDTLYIGSRKSLQMGRVYDKGAESRLGNDDELPSSIYWRYEVELKQEKAEETFIALKKLKGQYGAVISTFVHDWFIERGVVPAFEREAVNLVIDAAVVDATENHDAQRKLAWLVRCVSPVIRDLQVEYTDYTILEALNLIE